MLSLVVGAYKAGVGLFHLHKSVQRGKDIIGMSKAMHEVGSTAESLTSSRNNMRLSNNSSSQVDGVSSQVDGVSSKVDGVSSQVDGLSSKVDGVSSQVDGFSSQVDGLSTRVESVQQGLVEFSDFMETELDTMNGFMELQNTQLLAITSGQVDTHEMLNQLEKTIKEGFAGVRDTMSTEFTKHEMYQHYFDLKKARTSMTIELLTMPTNIVALEAAAKQLLSVDVVLM
jgi:outer membrane murein-binding lipoprotein Lpp